MKNQRKYTKSSIREKLTKLYKQRKTQLSQGVIPPIGINGMSRHSSIVTLKQLLDYFTSKDDQGHINMVLILKAELLALLPSDNSKYQQEKRELIDLMAWCEKHHTLDPRSKYFPQEAA